MKRAEYELYGWNTPNGQKIVIALEEVSADYMYTPIDISIGEQHTESFRLVSPDAKIPVLTHHIENPITLFESGAILSYLADQFPILNGITPQEQALVASWTFWQVGQLGPLAGQFGRFQAMDTPNPDGIEHVEALVWRCLDVLENRLAQSPFLAGERLSIADIACHPWVASPQSYLQRYNIQWRNTRPALNDWAEVIAQRPAVRRTYTKP